MYNYLKFYKIPVTIVATKYDKVGTRKREKQIKVINETIRREDGDKIVYFSSVNKTGKQEIYDILDDYLDELEIE